MNNDQVLQLTITTEDNHDTPQTKETEATAAPPAFKCNRVWSEYQQRWTYFPKDPAYIGAKYYKYKCSNVVQQLNNQNLKINLLPLLYKSNQMISFWLPSTAKDFAM